MCSYKCTVYSFIKKDSWLSPWIRVRHPSWMVQLQKIQYDWIWALLACRKWWFKLDSPWKICRFQFPLWYEYWQIWRNNLSLCRIVYLRQLIMYRFSKRWELKWLSGSITRHMRPVDLPNKELNIMISFLQMEPPQIQPLSISS